MLTRIVAFSDVYVIARQVTNPISEKLLIYKGMLDNTEGTVSYLQQIYAKNGNIIVKYYYRASSSAPLLLPPPRLEHVKLALLLELENCATNCGSKRRVCKKIN